MKKHLKQILSLFLCALVIMGTFTMSRRPEAEAAGSGCLTSLTKESVSPTDRQQANILHMDRTVETTAADGSSSQGFDVTLTSYLDDLGAETTPIDIVFVLDASTSMIHGLVNHKDDVVAAVETIIKKLQNDGGKHRVGYATFGTTLVSDATTDELLDIGDALTAKNNALIKKTYLDAYSNTTAGWTAPYYGLEKAYDLLADSGDRIKMCVLITDGVPGILSFSTTFADYAINSASKLKKNGVIMYAVQTNFTYDWEGDINEREINEYFSRVSSFYGANATSLNNSCSPAYDEKIRSQYVYSEDDSDLLADRIKESIINTKLYPYVLNSSAVTQDVVTPYFTPSKASCTIEEANYNKDTKKLTSWSKSGTLTANISGQRVSVTGFDYIARAVSPYNDQSARIVIKYHIDPISNFFGGNSIPTITEGATSNNTYTTGGSGLYCNGVFLKPFSNIPVNVELRNPTFRMNGSDVKSGETKTFYVDPWNYKHEVDLDNYYNVLDINNTNVGTYFNKTNNRFVTVEVTGEFVSATTNNSTKTTLFKSTGPNINTKSKNQTAYEGYNITSEADDKFTVTYQIAPFYTFNKNTSVGKSATAKKAVGTCNICAKWNYVAAFKFVGDAPDGVTTPGNVNCGSTEYNYTYAKDGTITSRTPKPPEMIDSVTKNKSYCKYLKNDKDPSEAYIFSGFALNSNDAGITSQTGTITYNYTGWWYDDPDAISYVEVYLQDKDSPFDKNGDAKYSLYKEFSVQKKIDQIDYKRIAACDAEDYQFCDSRHEEYIYEIYDESNDAYEFYQFVLNDAYETKVMATASVYLCPTCGLMIRFEEPSADDSQPQTTECRNCSKEIQIEDALHYADYVPSVKIVRDTTAKTYKMYFSRVEHSVKTTITYDDNPNATKTYSYSTLTGCNLYDRNGLSKMAYDEDARYRADFDAAVISDDYEYLLEDTPFYNCSKWASFPILYSHDDFESYEYDYLNNYLEWADSYFIFDGDWGYMPAYDINLTVEMERIKYDLTVTKQWDSNVSQKDMQNCIFGLYEVNEIDGKRDYNLICRFAIGVDEFKYMNGVLTASKTIKGLCAGNEYVLEEESWSYKTKSDWYRGAENETVIYGVSNESIEKICRNRNDSNRTYAPTVEKGVRNQLSPDESSIIATNIKKNVKVGQG